MYQPYYPPSQPPPQPSRTPWGIIIAIVVVLGSIAMIAGVAGFWVVLRSRSHATSRGGSFSGSTSGSWSDADSPVPVSSNDPSWGDREAPVTIVAFGDFEDPFAARSLTALDSMKALYGESKLRIVWKNRAASYHTHAREAAEAGAGIFVLGGKAAFWHFEERALANQLTLSPASYETWATEAGVNVSDFRAGTARHDWAAKVDDDERIAKTLGIYGSTSFVNGTKLTYATTATWQKAIDDELPLAMSSGVSGDRIYVTRSKINFAAPAPTTTYAPPPTPTTTLTVHTVPIGTSPVLGRNDALVTLIEFADFQCPYCGRAEATMRALRTKYGADLRFVWKNEPLSFHPHALSAAELALDARDEKGDGMFWIVHDDIYASQATGLDDTQLLRIARDHGLNETRVKSAMTTHAHQTTIDADTTLAKKLSATGTPTFFINGRMLSGAQPQATFEAMIDDEIVKAKARVASGTARTKIYDAIEATATD